jgi:hypothetical protein
MVIDDLYFSPNVGIYVNVWSYIGPSTTIKKSRECIDVQLCGCISVQRGKIPERHGHIFSISPSKMAVNSKDFQIFFKKERIELIK